MITYKADPRHAGIIFKDMKMDNTKSMASPALKMEDPDVEDNAEVVGSDAFASRSTVARAKYLA